MAKDLKTHRSHGITLCNVVMCQATPRSRPICSLAPAGSPATQHGHVETGRPFLAYCLLQFSLSDCWNFTLKIKTSCFPSVQPTWAIQESPSSHSSLTLHPIHTSPGMGSKRSWPVFQTCRFLAALQLATVSGMMNGRARDKQRKVKTPKPSAICKVDTWGLCKPTQ